MSRNGMTAEAAALCARYGYVVTVKPSLLSLQQEQRPPLQPGEAQFRERCLGMKVLLDIESAVWSTRKAPVTRAVSPLCGPTGGPQDHPALIELSTLVTVLLASLEDADPKTRTARMFLGLGQLLDRMPAKSTLIKNAFRAESGASDARKAAVREAETRFVAGISGLVDDFAIDAEKPPASDAS